MNYELVIRHNDVVSNNDTVIHLGDFSFSEKEIINIFKALNGNHLWCIGNHDKAYKNPKLIESYLEMGFKEVFKEKIIELELNNKLTKVKLNHLPYASYTSEYTESDDKYAKNRPKNEGHVMFTGHVHEKWLVNREKKMFNCGVDLSPNYRPWSVPEIEEVLIRENMI